jgi:DNA primase
MSKDEIEKIRQIPITRILGIHSNNRRFSIRCPFHNDKSPSLVIYPDNSFYCFGCTKHGNNCIDFVMGLGCNFREAVDEFNPKKHYHAYTIVVKS